MRNMNKFEWKKSLELLDCGYTSAIQKKREFILDEVNKREVPMLCRLAGGHLFFGCGCVQHQGCWTFAMFSSLILVDSMWLPVPMEVSFRYNQLNQRIWVTKVWHALSNVFARCGYPAVNASYYDLSYHPASSNKDCKLYKNSRAVKCYNCDSCK